MRDHKYRAAEARQKQYARLREQLAQIGWISEGYVQARPSSAGAGSYPWTRKVKGKTICVALSKEQYEWLQGAIANWRVVQKTLRLMQQLSRQEMFASLPSPKRRKQLSKKTLGLI
jgi:hypothetical protein